MRDLQEFCNNIVIPPKIKQEKKIRIRIQTSKKQSKRGAVTYDELRNLCNVYLLQRKTAKK